MNEPVTTKYTSTPANDPWEAYLDIKNTKSPLFLV